MKYASVKKAFKSDDLRLKTPMLSSGNIYMQVTQSCDPDQSQKSSPANRRRRLRSSLLMLSQKRLNVARHVHSHQQLSRSWQACVSQSVSQPAPPPFPPKAKAPATPPNNARKPASCQEGMQQALTHGFVIDGQSSACGGNTVSGCTASSNMMVGIAQKDCSGNTITSNTASSNQFEGITADNQANGAQISGNTLTGNAIAGGVGSIGVDHSDGVVISHNQISSSMDGMPGIETKNNLGPSIGLSITGNTITGNFCNGMIQEDDLGGNNIIDC
ncbi:hypothetical protein WJX82_007560 [Trebouxia sp. C0006]